MQPFSSDDCKLPDPDTNPDKTPPSDALGPAASLKGSAPTHPEKKPDSSSSKNQKSPKAADKSPPAQSDPIKGSEPGGKKGKPPAKSLNEGNSASPDVKKFRREVLEDMARGGLPLFHWVTLQGDLARDERQTLQINRGLILKLSRFEMLALLALYYASAAAKLKPSPTHSERLGYVSTNEIISVMSKLIEANGLLEKFWEKIVADNLYHVWHRIREKMRRAQSNFPVIETHVEGEGFRWATPLLAIEVDVAHKLPP